MTVQDEKETARANLISTLRGEIATVLPRAPAGSTAGVTKNDDLYEAYLWCLVLQAARRRGYTDIEILDRHGATPKDVRLRRGPGRLSVVHQYTHAVLKLPPRQSETGLCLGADELEVHVGVRVRGRSGVLHEADVLVLPARIARQRRTDREDPHWCDPYVVIEAKYYSDKISLSLGRGFSGLMSELLRARGIFASTVPNPKIRDLLEHLGHVAVFGVGPGTLAEEVMKEEIGRILRCQCQYQKSPCWEHR
ncbi:hypothetical protein KIH74_07365 [Kineosporia sp. J2-2]|uniref:Restriction endonuclease n=1 Tax=Kineosporia corallincola TaxID=2835133 RepID=A0ABS5TCC5_9ACTN|nr:hypothetical protein [Kineosporia corallincola]MBT0768739.1 hypothetical protein [Kineosporia corallincola]